MKDPVMIRYKFEGIKIPIVVNRPKIFTYSYIKAFLYPRKAISVLLEMCSFPSYDPSFFLMLFNQSVYLFCFTFMNVIILVIFLSGNEDIVRILFLARASASIPDNFDRNGNKYSSSY